MVTMVSGEAITQTTHSQWIFRVEAPSSMETQVLADYTCKSLPYKKISMLSADFAGGWAASGGFARVFKQECQGKILQDLYAPLGTTDFAPILSRVDRSADALMTLELSPDAIGFVKQVRSMGLTMPILAHGATVDETLLPQEGNAAVGILAVDKYSPTLDNPGTKAFVAAYQKKFNKEPSGFPEVGYTTAQVIDAALKAVGKDATDKNKFLNAISKVNLTETARGSAFRFDSYGEGIFNIYILKVTDHNGTLQRDLVKTYTSVNQFWTWSPAQFLAMPSYDKLKGTNAG
jgi:branched-chain amino acid transport system substrate-binding protein